MQSAEDNSTDHVPHPVYRLPTKPFLVQPLPKTGSGFAPTIPLEKTYAKVPVRRWRKAQRVIRGIAGGQWVAPTWVGDKDSAYASATGRAVADERGSNKDGRSSNLNSPSVSIPKLPQTLSMPMISKAQKSKLSAVKLDATGSVSAVTSVDLQPEVHNTRPPSGMRHVLSAQDAEMDVLDDVVDDRQPPYSTLCTHHNVLQR